MLYWWWYCSNMFLHEQQDYDFHTNTNWFFKSFNIFIRFSYTCSANRMPVEGGRGAPGLSKHITGKPTAKNKRKRKVTWSPTVHYGNNGFEAAENCVTNTKWDHKVWKHDLVLNLHVYSKVFVHLQPFQFAILFSCILSLS